MPTWGIHLLTAKKLKKKLKIDNVNSFLFGNIITDVNNGYVIPNVSKIIEHKRTHYYSEYDHEKTGNAMYYNIKKMIKDNEGNLQNPMVLGYITHLMADSYWNSLTYKEHGIYNEHNELIGLTLNNGKSLIADGETRRRMKSNDFKIFTNDIYTNQLIDLPKYTEEIYEQAKLIPSIAISKEDIKKTIQYLNMVKNGLDLLETKYQIFTEKEMIEHIDLCVENIIMQLESYHILIG